ncbi:MAG: sigma factor-like helix-turn-helix DNA-binding protein, partial [Verrucomicrobiota bacterium]
FGELQDLLSHLDAREREVLVRRFGLDGESPLTLEEVGTAFKLTRERVRQLQQSALMRLRRVMTERQKMLSPEDVQRNRMAEARSEVLREFFRSKGFREDGPDDRKGL